MPYYTGAVAVARLLVLSVASISLLCGGGAFAQSSDDNVEVMVCPDANQSSFVVNAPQSDSVIDQPTTAISGSVLFISQIDFYIDDAYNHTLALGYRDVNFESDIPLSPGTHTLKFVATDSCSNTTHTQSLVITYEPAIQPSIGSEVETRIDGKAVSDSKDPDIEPNKNIVQDIIDDIIISPLITIGRSLDIISLPDVSAESRGQHTTKSVFFVFGSLLTLGAMYIGLIGVTPSKLSFLPYSREQLIGGLLVSGLAILVLVFIL